jgi:hypothetical protein
VGTFKETLDKAPRADVNIFGLASEISFEFMRDVPQHIRTSCLFIADSGQESALA